MKQKHWIAITLGNMITLVGCLSYANEIDLIKLDKNKVYYKLQQSPLDRYPAENQAFLDLVLSGKVPLDMNYALQTSLRSEEKMAAIKTSLITSKAKAPSAIAPPARKKRSDRAYVFDHYETRPVYRVIETESDEPDSPSSSAQ
jgi:hypothetical protein